MIASTTRVKDNVSIVDLEGRLIAGDAVLLYNVVQGLTSKGVSAILINLDGVDMMDSSGLGELTRSGKLAASKGATLKLANPSREVRRTLEMAGYLGLFAVFDSESVAVASFRG
jgi:anti-sigma B factor antagonist